MRRGERGVTLVELIVILAILALGAGAAAPVVGELLDGFRAHGATADLYGAVHLTRSRARATGTMHALVVEPDGRGVRVVEDPGGTARTVAGPLGLVDGTVVSSNATIHFSPKGFAVPAGTITITSGREVRRLVVNILGRVRIASGPPP